MAAKLLYRDIQGRDAAADLNELGSFLGRAVECVVRTDDAMVSRRNCKIRIKEGRWCVEDLGSANGTYVSSGSGPEQRIQHATLSHGDVIRCGSLQVRFVEVADAASLAQASARSEPQKPRTDSQKSSGSPSTEEPTRRDGELAAELATFRSRYETLARDHDKQRRHLRALAAELEASQHELSRLRNQGGDAVLQKEFGTGWLNIDAPRVIALGDTMLVRVLVCAAGKEPPADAEHRMVLGIRMDLVAACPGSFTALPLTAAEQPIDTAGLAVWEWLITAEVVGEELLLLLSIS